MKIAICAKHDLAGNLALNILVRALAPHHQIHVILSDYVLKAERETPSAATLLTYERDFPLETFYPFLEQHVPVGSGALCLTPAGLSSMFQLPVHHWGRARSREVIDAMQRLAPDLILSCRYDYIFPEEILEIPPLGAYGMHPGRLPQIQGLCAPFWAMLQEHDRSGCTLFQIDKGIDSGPVVEIGWTPVNYSRSLLWNFVHTYFAGVATFLRHLPTLIQGDHLQTHPQDPSARRYYSYPTEADFRRFREKGNAIVTSEDYQEMLSWYLPGGMQDPLMSEIKRLCPLTDC
ncbi:formyltransferase family protein [Desulfoplanes formicivorans]|uniref:Formyl transferase N-terminal domain-containing protein n=1 Tax=Desulfoplanes formicivorans TaxID=1592317 RepID=A0A194AH13_9BACT|nr:formyltransferase family protein [Desulfoplanes formicivorans]GAU08618.1 hypothetical protein DPF_1332 [Desulfoplanes formicivorans]